MEYKTAFPKQPQIKISFTNLDLLLEIVSLAGLVVMTLLIIKAWAILPAAIPSHFNGMGQPDGYSGKSSLLLLPLVGLLLYLMLGILRFFPHAFSYPWPITEQNAEFQYRLAVDMLALLKFEVIWSLAYITGSTIKTALKQANGLGESFLLIIFFAIFATLGTYFYLAFHAK